MLEIEVNFITFEQISPIWSEFLWDKKYKFEPTSAMLFLGGYDVNISKIYKPVFIGAFYNEEMVGVLSGHQTSDQHYRLRGLYVKKEYRNKLVAHSLIHFLMDHIVKQTSCNFIWLAPRTSNVKYFENLGFKLFSEPTEQGFLYGPNCYMGIEVENWKCR